MMIEQKQKRQGRSFLELSLPLYYYNVDKFYRQN